MSHEAAPVNDFSEEERAQLSKELRDPATSVERLEEIAESVHARTRAESSEEQTATGSVTGFATLTDNELQARLVDPNVPGAEKNAIASYIHSRRHYSDSTGDEDTPGTPE